MVVKDHHSRLCYLKGIPRKQAKYVAEELSLYFGFIGYPQIFQTDNGKEFVAAQVVKALKVLNPMIRTVTGRPRKPNDQGSVENLNKQVKRVIKNVIIANQLNGVHTNWYQALGQTMMSLNQLEGKGGEQCIPLRDSVWHEDESDASRRHCVAK
jgi:transposase InsO family protein